MTQFNLQPIAGSHHEAHFGLNGDGQFAETETHLVLLGEDDDGCHRLEIYVSDGSDDNGGENACWAKTWPKDRPDLAAAFLERCPTDVNPEFLEACGFEQVC